MTRKAIAYFESQKKRLEDFREIYPSPDTVGYQATTKEISFYDMAISALSAEGKYIKKEEFKSAIHNFFYGLKHNVTEEDIQAYADALALYSFPEREKGEWIEHEKVYECSNCNIIRAKGTTGKYNYCPSCGADMRGDKSE